MNYVLARVLARVRRIRSLNVCVNDLKYAVRRGYLDLLVTGVLHESEEACQGSLQK